MIVASPRGKTKGPASRVPPGGGPKLSLTERVYAALKKDIITGELMPGQAFTENDLAHYVRGPRTRSTCVFMESSPLGNTWPFCELFCVRIPNSPAGSCASTSSGARGNRNSAICFSRDMLDCQRLRFFRVAEGRPR